MPALERLDLQHNNLLNAGCEVVAAFMHENSQLKYESSVPVHNIIIPQKRRHREVSGP